MLATKSKVVVPYAPGKLNSYVPRVLKSYGHDPELVLLRGKYSYGKLLKRLWEEGETVVIVEQDILPWWGAVEELHNCIGFWCTCSYPYGGAPGLYHMLGCTKLSDELMARLPGLWDEPIEWGLCDGHLLHRAREIELDPHPHRPPVVHLSEQELAA